MVGDLPRVVFHSTRYFAETLDASVGTNDVIAMRQRGRKSPASRRHYTAPLLLDQVHLLCEQGPAGVRVGADGAADQAETA